MISSGIEPATSCLVVQCLNQLLHPSPPFPLIWRHSISQGRHEVVPVHAMVYMREGGA